jgi:hypothetical protein
MPLPKLVADDVVMKMKECPVLTARRVKVDGSVEVRLFPEPDGTPPTNPVMRIPNPLNRLPEGVIVTRQVIAGSVRLYMAGDPAYDALSPPVDPLKDLIVQASVPGMTVRLLAL